MMSEYKGRAQNDVIVGLNYLNEKLEMPALVCKPSTWESKAENCH